jgi:putative flippase GtrA
MPALLRRIISFLSIGLVGLAVDALSYHIIFDLTGIAGFSRFSSLLIATPVTWSLNRWLTFAASGHSKQHEALRYGLVTGIAQSFNLGFFMFLRWLRPDIAPGLADQWLIVISAVTAAGLSFSGHFLFSFAPSRRKAQSESF